MKQQTYIVFMFSDKNGLYDDFFRYSWKSINRIIKDVINGLELPIFKRQIEKGNWKHIKIYKTHDGYHKEKNPEIDMPIAEFIKKF